MRLMDWGPAGLRAAAVPSHRPVNVCFVIDRLSRAGTESQLLALIDQLDRDQVQPHLCLLDGRDSLTESLQPDDCPVLDVGLRKLISPRAAFAAFQIARFWRRHRVDIVVSYFLDSTYFAAPLARVCGVRRVVRVRNNDGYWLNRRHRALGRLMGRICHVTLTNSEAGRRAIIAAERLADDRVCVLENGVDTDRFDVRLPPDTSRPIVRIGAVANLRRVKNIDGLIRAAAVVCAADARAQFEVAGAGDERAALERQIRTAGLDGRFRLLGEVADVPEFLARLDVAVLASHSESMSNAILEYMAAGRAIVATDVGANTKLIRDGREGLIVPRGDDAALAQAITSLLESPAVARHLGIAAQERARSHFSRRAMLRRFEEFFLSLVKR